MFLTHFGTVQGPKSSDFRKFIDFLERSEKNKWCPEEDSNLHALASAAT